MASFYAVSDSESPRRPLTHLVQQVMFARACDKTILEFDASGSEEVGCRVPVRAENSETRNRSAKQERKWSMRGWNCFNTSIKYA